MTSTLSPQMTASLLAVEARLLILLEPEITELLHVRQQPLEARINLMTFLLVLTASIVRGRVSPEQRKTLAQNAVRETFGYEAPPFPYTRHCRLLLTLVVRGCERRGELALGGVVEGRLRRDEAEYRRRYGDDAYHRLIVAGDDVRPEHLEQEAA